MIKKPHEQYQIVLFCFMRKKRSNFFFNIECFNTKMVTYKFGLRNIIWSNLNAGYAAYATLPKGHRHGTLASTQVEDGEFIITTSEDVIELPEHDVPSPRVKSCLNRCIGGSDDSIAEVERKLPSTVGTPVAGSSPCEPMNFCANLVGHHDRFPKLIPREPQHAPW